MKSISLFLGILALIACLSASNRVYARGNLLCVPYARALSGIDLFGNAKTWWAQAGGRYDRGNEPREGSVLALRGHGKMYNGHVAVVSRITNTREILLNHANWSRRGGIERNVKAIDVSDKGDWSCVKMWFSSNGAHGTASYPAFGFIYNGK